MKIECMMDWYGVNFNSRSVIGWALFILLMCDCYWLVASDGQKIVGGRDALKGEFPSTLCFRSAIRCGATLVTLDKFLTGGSCFEPKVNISYIALFGGNVDIRDKGTQEIYVMDYKRHKKYENRTTSTGYYILNDIAVGILESAFVQTDTLSPAVFPANNEAGMKAFVDNVIQTKQTCLAAGYGAIDFDNPVDSVSFSLKVLEIQLLPDGDCGLLPEMVGKELCGTAVKQADHMYVGDTGTTVMCGGKIIGMTKDFKKIEKDGKSIYVTTFVLFGPYLEVFSLGKGEGTKLFQLHPVIFLSLLVSKLQRTRTEEFLLI